MVRASYSTEEEKRILQIGKIKNLERRKETLRSFARARGRSYGGVYAKMSTLLKVESIPAEEENPPEPVVKRKYNKKKESLQASVVVENVNDGRTLVFPIKDMYIKDKHLVVHLM